MGVRIPERGRHPGSPATTIVEIQDRRRGRTAPFFYTQIRPSKMRPSRPFKSRLGSQINGKRAKYPATRAFGRLPSLPITSPSSARPKTGRPPSGTYPIFPYDKHWSRDDHSSRSSSLCWGTVSLPRCSLKLNRKSYAPQRRSKMPRHNLVGVSLCRTQSSAREAVQAN